MGSGIGGYYLIGIVAFIVSLAISGWLRSTYARWSKVANSSGLTGAQVAAAILKANNITNVRVEATRGQLTDHYDPTKRVVRLSEGIYGKANVAGMAVAAHEVGTRFSTRAPTRPCSGAARSRRWQLSARSSGLFAAMIGLFLVRHRHAQHRHHLVFGRGALSDDHAAC
jgi:hypothetical protein